MLLFSESEEVCGAQRKKPALHKMEGGLCFGEITERR